MFNKIWNGKFKGLISALFVGIIVIYDKLIDRITTVFFKLNIKDHGKNIKVCRGVYYRYPKKIEIGNNIIIGKKTVFSSEISNDNFIKVEDGVSIGGNCHIDFSGGIIINKDAHIAHFVHISTHDHGYDYNSIPIGKKLIIGENAFIGSRVIIMHNCNYIGKDSVIGTGSLVTKDVPDHAVVAGNPAKVIKYR